MTTFLSDLESEIAFTVFRLREDRLSLRESAIHYNMLRLSPPKHCLESRLDSLTVELRHLKAKLS
jgi:hypothetical protein